MRKPCCYDDAVGDLVKFLTDNKDVLAFGVSIVALALSLFTSWWTLRTTREIARESAEHNRTLAQNATYQRIHELLVDPKAAAGRRRLFLAARNKAYPKLGDEAWDEINYSLALYDTLAGYVRRDQVDENVVLDAWHHPLANIAPPVREFMAHRRGEGVKQPWAHLLDLLKRAEMYHCTCPRYDDPSYGTAP